MNLANLSIMQIKDMIATYEHTQVPDDILDALTADKRKGVQNLAANLQAKRARESRLAEKWEEMTQAEDHFRQVGKRIIVGIDEVGRGPLAGPVVAAAVALPADFYLLGLDDSKKVPPAMREAFAEVIRHSALAVGVGIVRAERIDQINILQATYEAMRLAIQDAGVVPDVCLIDAVRIPDLPYEQHPIIGGDGKSVSIAAASIVAKVARDKLMAAYAVQYPGYGFERNVGYGSKEHLDAIRTFGPSPIHRCTFGGVKEYVRHEA